jgi:hypothetical protein
MKEKTAIIWAEDTSLTYFVSGDHKHSPVTLDQLADAVRAGAYLIECGQLF